MVSTKERIKRFTDASFAQSGYNASLHDIAKKTGIKTPSLYTHFRSKEKLFFQVIKEEIERYYFLIERQFELLAGQTAHDQIRGIFLSTIDYFNVKNRARFWHNISLIKERSLRSKCTLLIQQNQTTYSKKMMEIFSQGIANKEFRETVDVGTFYLWMAMVQGLLIEMLLYENTSFDIQSYALKTWQAFWDGIKYNTNE